MASGFSGGGDFYSSTGINGGGGSASGFYRPQQQLGGVLLDSSSSSSMIPQRRTTDLLAKRSLAELQHQHQQQQQQQQQQAFLLRSVKQRTYNQQNQNRTSPISPLSPIDFDFSAVSGGISSRYNRYGGQGLQLPPLLKPQQSMVIQNSYQPCFSNLSFSNSVHQESDNDSDKKMRNRLQELEKQLLLDDIDEEEEHEGDAVSVITSSEWTETMQNLLSPNQNQNQNQKPISPISPISPVSPISPISPSPTSSSSSSSSSSVSHQLSSSSSSKQTLIDAATAISEGTIEIAIANLDRLKPISNTRGDPEQRLTAYMASALRSRINPIEYPSLITERNEEEIVATQLLHEASPCFKLGFMAANLAILDRTRDQPNNVHVIDFEIGQGNQYITLIQALAERVPTKTATLKITAVTDPSNRNEDGLRIVGDRLKKLAGLVGIGSFKFKVVCGKISELNREVFCLHDPDESLVVNFSFLLHKLPDESVSTENPRDELLRFVKGLKPRVVTLVEQEMNCNTAPFVARLSESCGYYRALFDSLDAILSRDSVERVRVEECLGRKAANSVACEGRDRVERCEVFGKWRARMGMAGFKSVPLSQHISESLRVKLSSVYRNKNPGFTIKEEGGGICFGWMGRVLTVASAWN